MYYGYDYGIASKARHADLIRDAEIWRRARGLRAALPQRSDWTTALRVWLGRQLVGWGRQLGGVS
jgi:hypothetical protein